MSSAPGYELTKSTFKEEVDESDYTNTCKDCFAERRSRAKSGTRKASVEIGKVERDNVDQLEADSISSSSELESDSESDDDDDDDDTGPARKRAKLGRGTCLSGKCGEIGGTCSRV